MTKKILFTTCAALLAFAGEGGGDALAAAQGATPQLTVLYQFSQSQNGEGEPEGTLAEVGGALYGAATQGGSAGQGTIFRYDLASGVETTLSSFTGGKRDGAVPFGPVTRVGTSVYGSTVEGHGTGPGSNGNYTGYGTIWRLNTVNGKARVFHGFNGADGSQPFSGVMPVGSVFYGVAWYGGPGNAGTVFELDASGKLTTLYTFPDSAIGCNPEDAVTVVGHMLYGTTTFCGAGGAGTVFSLNLATRQAKLLHSFAPNGNGSAGPNALLYQDGVLYGTTFDDGGAGNVFKIDLKSGQYSLLHQFSGGADGDFPTSGLTAFHGKLYGETEHGGANQFGTIYAIDPATGSQTVAYSFTGGADGDSPFGGLLADAGALYGSSENINAYPNIRGALFKFVP